MAVLLPLMVKGRKSLRLASQMEWKNPPNFLCTISQIGPTLTWGYYDDQAMVLPDFLDHPVKESCRRVSIGSETRPVYVQSIYVPSLWVWDRICTVEVGGSGEWQIDLHEQ